MRVRGLGFQGLGAGRGLGFPDWIEKLEAYKACVLFAVSAMLSGLACMPHAC